MFFFAKRETVSRDQSTPTPKAGMHTPRTPPRKVTSIAVASATPDPIRNSYLVTPD